MADLAATTRERFRMAVGPLKGLDCRIIEGRVRRELQLVEVVGPAQSPRMGEQVYAEIRHFPRTVWQR